MRVSVGLIFMPLIVWGSSTHILLSVHDSLIADRLRSSAISAASANARTTFDPRMPNARTRTAVTEIIGTMYEEFWGGNNICYGGWGRLGGYGEVYSLR